MVLIPLVEDRHRRMLHVCVCLSQPLFTNFSIKPKNESIQLVLSVTISYTISLSSSKTKIQLNLIKQNLPLPIRCNLVCFSHALRQSSNALQKTIKIIYYNLFVLVAQSHLVHVMSFAIFANVLCSYTTTHHESITKLCRGKNANRINE